MTHLLAIATVSGVVMLFPVAASSIGNESCLSGTATEVTNDASQITVVRAAVDAACPCSSFDGSSGKTHKDYVRCASTAINGQADAGNLRVRCKQTVKRYYARSTCGRNPLLHVEPCVQTNLRTGKITCTIRPTTRLDGVTPTALCRDYSATTRVSCPTKTHCIDAADTDGNLLIAAPGDSGSCDFCGNGIVDAGEMCDPPGSECNFLTTCQSDCTCPCSTPFGQGGPQCGGPCPPGQACGISSTSPNSCACFPAGEYCGNGVTDPGESCDPPGFALCGYPPHPCGSDCTCPCVGAFGSCGGTCPPGEVCTKDFFSCICAAEPNGQPCGNIESPFCGDWGACPEGQTCMPASALSGGECFCGPADQTGCGESCGGLCPPDSGLICGQLPPAPIGVCGCMAP
jgi:hypothetical protein